MFLFRLTSVCAVLLFFSHLLLAADWDSGNGFRSKGLDVPRGGRTFLQHMDAQTTGLNFMTYISEEKALENTLLTAGAGIAAGDVDGDGLCDLFFCGMENSPVL